MKKILLVTIFSSLLLGCTPILYKELVGVADFRPYTESGFVLSPVSDGYKYSPIGTIAMTFHPGAAPKVDGEKSLKDAVKQYEKNVDDMYQDTGDVRYNNSKYSYFEPNVDYCLAKIVEYATSLGATGILELRLLSHYKYGPYNTKTLDYIEAAGFAVVIVK